MKSSKTTIEVKGTAISILSDSGGDFISLTDMLKAKDGDFFISDWLRNRNTVEFLGIWESVHNPGFNSGEFAIIKSQAGLNSYKLSVKDWVEKTGAVGLRATAGRYGGTFAHKDIAFEFGMWISPEFKIYLIKEFQRLKEDESQRLSLAWNFNRTLSKLNYRIHTDAVKTHLLPLTSPTPMNPFEEIVQFIAEAAGAEKLAAFKPSRTVETRVAGLLARQQTGTLTPQQNDELQLFVQLDHVMSLAKAVARTHPRTA